MGRRGPKETPTALKLARGNPGKRTINAEEPELAIATHAAPPEGMSKRAVQVWRSLHGTLVAAGVLTEGDLDTFATYCSLVAECEAVEKMARKVGLENAMRFGYSGMLLKLRAQKKQYAAELGLTPSSRSSVKKVKVADPADEKRKRFFGLVQGGASGGGQGGGTGA